jgi:hypothetical protein
MIVRLNVKNIIIIVKYFQLINNRIVLSQFEHSSFISRSSRHHYRILFLFNVNIFITLLSRQIKSFVATRVRMRTIDIHCNIMCCLNIYRNLNSNASDWHSLKHHINMRIKNVLFKQIKFFDATSIRMRTIDIHWSIISICELRTCYSDRSSSLSQFQFECERLTFIEASYQYAN